MTSSTPTPPPQIANFDAREKPAPWTQWAAPGIAPLTHAVSATVLIRLAIEVVVQILMTR